jgi:hypothetical protein
VVLCYETGLNENSKNTLAPETVKLYEYGLNTRILLQATTLGCFYNSSKNRKTKRRGTMETNRVWDEVEPEDKPVALIQCVVQYDMKITNHCTCPGGTPYAEAGSLVRNCEKCYGFRKVKMDKEKERVCKNCTFWAVFKGPFTPDGFGSCSSEHFLGGHRVWENVEPEFRPKENEIAVETDVGWGFTTGPLFGCVHFKEKK